MIEQLIRNVQTRILFYGNGFSGHLEKCKLRLDGETGHETDHDKSVAAKRIHLLQYCNVERSREEMQEFLGVSSRAHFKKAYLRPLLESGQLQMTLPDKPQSRNQKYVTVQGDSAE